MAIASIPSDDITGVVLAGGRGTRMGGGDKGLQNHLGMPLALHGVLRLQRQVGTVMIAANRNLAAYEAMGVSVWPDATPDCPGPLAGLLTGLERCETPWLLAVPCDAPDFPEDLAERLAQALAGNDADIAVAAAREHGTVSPKPEFCLLRAMLLEDLMAALQAGERDIERWTGRHRRVVVEFDDPDAFFDANTPQELHRLQQRRLLPG
jgi:molybdopterin-guanine dinucleotide biosynthesis protein A